MATKKVKADSELYSPMEMYCIGLNEFYKGLRKAGFSESITLAILIERNAHPDWLLPKMPDFDPNNPDHTDWEDDD